MITKEIAQKVIDVVSCGLVSGMGQPIPGQMCVEAAVCYAMGLPHSDQPTCVSPVLRTLKITLNDASWSSNAARTNGLKRLSVLQLGTDNDFDELDFTKRVAEMVIRKIVPNALRKAAEIHPVENHKVPLLEAADKCEQEGTQSAAADAAAAAYAAAAAAAVDARAAYRYAAAAVDARAAVDAAAAVDARAAVDAAAAAAARAAVDAAAYAAARAAVDAYAYAAAAAAVDAYAYAAAAAAAYAAAEDEILQLFATEVENILIDMKVPGVQWLDLIK